MGWDVPQRRNAAAATTAVTAAEAGFALAFVVSFHLALDAFEQLHEEVGVGDTDFALTARVCALLPTLPLAIPRGRHRPHVCVEKLRF